MSRRFDAEVRAAELRRAVERGRKKEPRGPCLECGGTWWAGGNRIWHKQGCTRWQEKLSTAEAQKADAMLGRDYHARYLRDEDACPTHGYSPWQQCPACLDYADRDDWRPAGAELDA